MRIVNVSGKESVELTNPVVYTLLDATEFESLVNYGDVEISSSTWSSEDAAEAHCKNVETPDLYIARIEIVAKTV